eukprot:GHVQ01042767.1.p1 GENE.GHVQ01042767.1~~GHVQ01042767.1.p1  ORF type:complete len:115 (-),score=13.14 GHVQ01042767.1:171-515(-)
MIVMSQQSSIEISDDKSRSSSFHDFCLTTNYCIHYTPLIYFIFVLAQEGRRSGVPMRKERQIQSVVRMAISGSVLYMRKLKTSIIRTDNTLTRQLTEHMEADKQKEESWKNNNA